MRKSRPKRSAVGHNGKVWSRTLLEQASLQRQRNGTCQRESRLSCITSRKILRLSSYGIGRTILVTYGRPIFCNIYPSHYALCVGTVQNARSEEIERLFKFSTRLEQLTKLELNGHRIRASKADEPIQDRNFGEWPENCLFSELC